MKKTLKKLKFYAKYSPFKKGGLFIAPRTILKVMCWGEKLVYPTGKLAFSYICPVEDMGLPKGYKSTKASKIEAVKAIDTLKMTKNMQKSMKIIKNDTFNF